MLNVEMLQRPVGQGGLFEGVVDAGSTPLRWVYDCGSNQKEALSREVNSLRGPIDLLFLSHLDDDHVSGLDILLARHKAAEVILPYLTDVGRLLALGKAISDGRLSGLFVDFLSNPSDWLLRRDVERVTFVRGSDDDSKDGPVPDEPRPGRQEVDGLLLPKWTREPRRLAGKSREIRVAEQGTFVCLSTNSGLADWTLLPQVYPPSKARAAAFGKALAKHFPGLAPAEIAERAWTVDGREKMRACYEGLWTDHNLISMSLYMGPTPHSQRNWSFELRHRYLWMPERGSLPGWLSTGDADLSVSSRRRAFHHFYNDYLDQISVLVVSHHGSSTSWHDDILEGMSSLSVGCAAAGRNGYGHPHRAVIDSFRGLDNMSFVRVCHKKGTSLQLKGHC
jgi:hypothetical protein